MAGSDRRDQPREARRCDAQFDDLGGGVFVQELHLKRGSSLKAGIDFGSGEIRSGVEAKELGLVDALGTLEEAVSETWALKTYDFGPQQRGSALLTSFVSDALVATVESLIGRQPRLR